MVKHPWPLLEISLSDFRGLATLNINTLCGNNNDNVMWIALCGNNNDDVVGYDNNE